MAVKSKTLVIVYNLKQQIECLVTSCEVIFQNIRCLTRTSLNSEHLQQTEFYAASQFKHFFRLFSNCEQNNPPIVKLK